MKQRNCRCWVLMRNKMGKVDRKKLRDIWDIIKKRKTENTSLPSAKIRAELKKYTEIVFYDKSHMDDELLY